MKIGLVEGGSGRSQVELEKKKTLLIWAFGGSCQIVQGLGNQSDKYNGVNLLPLELVEVLSRNGQDQCFSSLKGLWSIEG